jgi:hypothetical protein
MVQYWKIAAKTQAPKIPSFSFHCKNSERYNYFTASAGIHPCWIKNCPGRLANSSAVRLTPASTLAEYFSLAADTRPLKTAEKY